MITNVKGILYTSQRQAAGARSYRAAPSQNRFLLSLRWRTPPLKEARLGSWHAHSHRDVPRNACSRTTLHKQSDLPKKPRMRHGYMRRCVITHAIQADHNDIIPVWWHLLHIRVKGLCFLRRWRIRNQSPQTWEGEGTQDGEAQSLRHQTFMH